MRRPIELAVISGHNEPNTISVPNSAMSREYGIICESSQTLFSIAEGDTIAVIRPNVEEVRRDLAKFVHQNSEADIARLKERFMKTTNYSVLASAALAGTATLIASVNGLYPLVFWGIFILTLGNVILTLMVQGTYWGALVVFRERVAKARQALELEKYGLRLRPLAGKEKADDLHSAYFMMAVFAAGVLSILYLSALATS